MTEASHTKPESGDVMKTRVLINVSVVGGTGPLRMLVNGDDPVNRVVRAALKLYGREGRVPVLGSDPDRFLMYCRDSIGSHVVLGAFEAIGSTGARSFLLAPKNPPQPRGAQTATQRSRAAARFKSWRVKVRRWVK